MNPARARYVNHTRWLYRMMRRNERGYTRELRLRRAGSYSEPRWVAAKFLDAEDYYRQLLGDLDRARAIHATRCGA